MICPLCLSNDTTVISEELRSGPGRVYFCVACDLGFLAPANGFNLQQYYEERYRLEHGPELGKVSNAGEVFRAHVDYQEGRLRLLSPFMRSDTRLLEVGSSCGQFLHHARQRVGAIAGIDYNIDHCDFARTHLNCEIHAGPPETAPFPSASFDIVCAFQTLEHSPDPIAFIEALAGFLAPGGLLALEVPNLYDPLRSVYDSPAYRSFYFHEAHLFYFSGKSLQATAAKAGFFGDNHFCQDYNLTNHLHWAYCNQPQSNCHMGLGPAALPLSPNCPEEARLALSEWAIAADRTYKKLLSKLELTDNIMFLGHRRSSS